MYSVYVGHGLRRRGCPCDRSDGSKRILIAILVGHRWWVLSAEHRVSTLQGLVNACSCYPCIHALKAQLEECEAPLIARASDRLGF